MAKLIGLPSKARFRFLRTMRDGRMAYVMERPDGVSELRFWRK